MEDIYTLSSRAVDLVAAADPILATEAGITGHDHRWPDLSPSGHNERNTVFEALLTELAAVETASADEVLAARVLAADLEQRIEAVRSEDHLRDLNNIASGFQNIKAIFDLMARDSAEAWTNIVTRLESIAEPLAGYRSCLVAGADRSMAVARRQTAAVTAEGRLTAGEASPLRDLVASFDEVGVGDAVLRGRLSSAVNTACSAFGEFTDWLESAYLPECPTADSVGEDRYVLEARKHLGMTIDVRETYAWGWSEIARLWGRLEVACAKVDATKTIDEVIELLCTDPARAAATAEEFIDTMSKVQHAALEQLSGTHFEVPEQVRQIEVKVAPAGGALAPYYSAPSEDFSRPGTVWYPLGTRTFFPLWGEITTAYHEGFPGHHLQVGVQVTLGDRLSRYHRTLVWQPGSGEGWALYAEQLMYELGFLAEPAYEIGQLAAQLLRSCRVVIDIGMHCELTIPDDSSFHPGAQWTFDLASEMLRDVALQTPEVAESEATRYFGWPGQAISYKVGERVILDLRNELSKHQEFDLKRFHSKVLGVGSVGLELLQEMVRA